MPGAIPTCLICARTDAAGVEGLNAAIERCQLFMEAGADMAKPMGADTVDEIKRVLREVPGPHMATISQAAGAKHRDLGELEAAGVAAVTFPSVALFAAAQAVSQAMAALKRDHSLAAVGEALMPLPDYYDLIGLKAQLAREESYDRAAAALVSRRRRSRDNGGMTDLPNPIRFRRMLQIGICGTFDVQNYGDLLFPLLAEAELSRRFGPITLHRFSYFDKAPPEWPYDVTSLVKLPKLVRELDGMIIGGGALIRFDKGVAPGYFPPSPDIHHPTGYWLTPALTCLDAGCPVAWGAPGRAGGAVPRWAEPLMRLAIGLSRYVAVRDDDTRATLAPFADERDIAVVPDTCFGLPRLLQPNRPSPAWSRLRQSLQLARPYIVIQAAHGLGAFARLVAEHPARFAGYQFVALPVGPVLGDDAAILGDSYPDLVKLPDYPHPLLMAELIAGAAGVVGISLHLGITAIAFGVPIFRPTDASGGKYALLSGHSNVHFFPADGEISPAWLDVEVGATR